MLTLDWIKLPGSDAIHEGYVTSCKTSLPWVGKTCNTYTLFAPPLQMFCVNIVFNFSWNDCNTQEKLKAKVMQNFKGPNKVYYGRYAYGELKQKKMKRGQQSSSFFSFFFFLFLYFFAQNVLVEICPLSLPLLLWILFWHMFQTTNYCIQARVVHSLLIQLVGILMLPTSTF